MTLSPSIQQNKQLAGDFLRSAFANRMLDALAMLHPEATWWVLGDPERLKVSGLKDRAKIERLLSGFAKALPGGMEVQIHGMTAEEDRVAVEIEAEGNWYDGRRYQNRYHFLIEIRDDKIFRVREYMDTLAVYELSKV